MSILCSIWVMFSGKKNCINKIKHGVLNFFETKQIINSVLLLQKLWDIQSLKLNWRILEEDTKHETLVSSIYIHPHDYIEPECICPYIEKHTQAHSKTQASPDSL